MKTMFSERLGGVELPLGKLPATQLRSGTVRYDQDIRPELVKAGVLPSIPELLPAMFGHGHDFAQGAWKMLGNGPLAADEGEMPESWVAALKGAGNCTIADCYHMLMEAEKNAGRPISLVTAERAIKTYVARTLAANGTAYDPETGEGDTGLDIQAVIEWLVAEGAETDDGVFHKALDPIALEPGNVQHLWEGVWLYEAVKVGLVITEAQQEQFDASPQPTWDYVAGSQELGGHDTPVVGKIGLLSWAEDVYYTPRFIEKQNDESFAVLLPEQFREDGKDYEGLTEGDIVKLSVEIATEKVAAIRQAA